MPTQQSEVILDNNDNLLWVRRLRDESSETYLDGAADVKVTLLTPAGVEIGGQSWPLDLTYVPDSDGDFYALLSADLALTIKQKLEAKIVVNPLGSPRATAYIPCVVRRRTS